MSTFRAYQGFIPQWPADSSLSVLQINGIGSENAQTTSISISPQYNSSDSSNDITGYMYTYGLEVTVKNLTSDLLSKVLDTAVAAGGNQLQIQQVSVSSPLAYVHSPASFTLIVCRTDLPCVQASCHTNESVSHVTHHPAGMTFHVNYLSMMDIWSILGMPRASQGLCCTCAMQFSLSDATTAQVMVAARKLSVASAKAAADIYASVCTFLHICLH